jgi:hypothetical protein
VYAHAEVQIVIRNEPVLGIDKLDKKSMRAARKFV